MCALKSIFKKYFEWSILKVISTVQKVFKILKYKILNSQYFKYQILNTKSISSTYFKYKYFKYCPALCITNVNILTQLRKPTIPSTNVVSESVWEWEQKF